MNAFLFLNMLSKMSVLLCGKIYSINASLILVRQLE